MSETKSGNAFDMKILTRLYRYGRPYRTSFLFTFILVLVLAGLVVVRPAQMRIILDEKMPSADYNGVVWISICFAAVLFIEAVIQYFQTRMANRIAQSITMDLRGKLYRHVLKFKLSYYDRTPVGQFVTRHVSDIDGIAEVFSVGLLDIFRDLLKIIVLVFAMFMLDWKMSLVVLLPIPVLLYATRIFQRAVKNSFNDVRNEVARISVFIQEHVTGMHIVQIFNKQKEEQKKFQEINRKHRDAHIRGIWAYSIFFPLVELLSAASVALMIWWGLHESLQGVTTPGILLQFSTFIGLIYRPIRQMADNFNVLQMGMVNAERVFKVFDTNEQQIDKGIKNLTTLRGDIQFEHVWFAYKNDDWILKDISMHINPGETVALVGATGAGKSSIAGLLNRFYDYQKGAITVDGIPIQEYELNNLRHHIAMVQQDVFLFSNSILNNITLNNSAITEEAVVEAAKAVGAHDFIQKLPGGYQFNVRERGGTLSVGQRQLISFVRAYVQNPAVLVLDEATSSVDTESELLIQKATEKLTSGRTSIIIAHRLSTIRNANKIIVMEKGKIVETGTHQELLKKEGYYKRLYLLSITQDEEAA